MKDTEYHTILLEFGEIKLNVIESFVRNMTEL